MPILESLRENFNKLDPEAKVNFIRAYRKRRAEDMAKPPTYGSTASAKKNESIRLQNMGLTPEEIELAKTLGLKPKDILRLKEAKDAY